MQDTIVAVALASFWGGASCASWLLLKSLDEVQARSARAKESTRIQTLPSVMLNTTTGPVATSQFIGRGLTIAFVAARRAGAREFQRKFQGSLAVFQQRTGCDLVLVLCGTPREIENCRWDTRRLPSCLIVHDTSEKLRRRFRVTRMPAAIEFGSDGRLVRFGNMVSSSYIEVAL